jgi:hypothetical protein
MFIILPGIEARRAADIYNAGDFMFSFAVFRCFRRSSAVISRYFCCYFPVTGFKSPGFLRQREIPPLYFSGIISGISERPMGRIEGLRRCRCPTGIC